MKCHRCGAILDTAHTDNKQLKRLLLQAHKDGWRWAEHLLYCRTCAKARERALLEHAYSMASMDSKPLPLLFLKERLEKAYEDAPIG